MGDSILKLITLFDRVAPDQGIHNDLKVLVADYELWSTAHRVRDGVRDRLLCSEEKAKLAYYTFAESCLESIYNETNPIDPFDTVVPFWVVPHAVALAKLVGISVEAIINAT